jgi:myosin heavy subunit
MTKKIIKAEETAVIVRPLEVIAIEIRSIDTQARKVVLDSAIEIGKRLIEAKSLVDHGEWGGWLETNVSYSQSTANNFMRVATEYDGANSHTFGNLSYSQAVALLAVPSDEREAFVEEHNVEDMSSRELQAAIKEKQELESQLQKEQERTKAEQVAREEEKGKREALFDQYQQELELRRKYETELAAVQAEAEKPQSDAKADAKLKVELRKAEKAATESQKRITELEADMQEKIKAREDVLEAEMAEKLILREQAISDQAKQITEMQELLKKSQNQAANKEVQVHYGSLVETSKLLLTFIAKMEDEDLKKAIQGRIATLCDEIKASTV